MKIEAFMEEFNKLADSPNSLARIRQLVLSLATSGKLDTQIFSDQSGYDLFQEISSIRDKAIKNRKVRNHIEGEKIIAGDSYRLPHSWYRCMISEVCDLQTGATPSRQNNSYFGGEIPWLVSGDINKGEIFECKGRITESGLKNSNCKIIPPNSVLIALNGQGKTRATVALLRLCATLNQSLVAMIPYAPEKILPEYIFWNLRGRYYAIRDITGQDQRRGLNMKLVGQLSLPIPPIAEQKRIVAKVDELMALCDKLEAQLRERDTRQAVLARVTLTHFAEAPTIENLNLVFHSSITIEPSDLRKIILTLAVQGKLTKQDNNEKAKELLRLARIERNSKIAQKQIKERPIFQIEPSEEPFVIPTNWQWAKLSDVGYELGQKIPKETFSYVDVGSIDSLTGRISDRVVTIEPDKAPSRARKIIKHGTVIYSTVRPYLLNTAVVDCEFKYEPIASTAFGILYPFHGMDSRFIFYWLRSDLFTSYVLDCMKGMAYPAINDEKFYSGYIPVPPLAEQHRIVAKVDQLMALVDLYEKQLNASREKAEQLLDAMVAELTTEA